MTNAASPPISSHSGFKWAVALWFAALLGLGLFVMPAPVHDLLAERLGLAAVLPGGLAGRAAVAAIAAVLGLFMGLVIAQRIALAHALEEDGEDWNEEYAHLAAAPGEGSVWLDDAGSRMPAEQPPAHRVFNPREEIGEDGIAGPPTEDHGLGELEEVELDGEGEDDALIQAWREERGLSGHSEPDTTDVEPLVETIEEPEAKVYGHPNAVEPETPLDAHDVGVRTEVEFDAVWDEPELEPEADLGTTPVAEPGTGAAPQGEAFGDMSLERLTTRLAQALAAARARDSEAETPLPPPVTEEQSDPVIAFLRREAERHTPGASGATGFADDPQAVLRSALDKLSRVSNPK